MPKDTPEKIIDSPYVRGVASVGGGAPGGGGGTPPTGDFAPTPHAHESVHHTGLLNWGSVNKAGSALSDLATRPHSALTGITPDQHHAQVHAVVSPDHTATGLTLGETVRATSASTFAWEKLAHTDLLPASITADQHHAQVHDILGSDHYLTANKFEIVGATENNVLGLLTATHNPGATERLLKTNALGSLYLDTNLLYVDAANNWVGINKVPAGASLDIIASSNADHTQRIKQKVGQTGRMWRVEDLDGNELVVLDSVGNLQSGRPGYVSGLTGWQISPQGNAEFNNIWARGELHATVFVKDEVHATGGTLLVATAATVHSDAQIDSAAVDRDDFMVESTAAAFPGTGPLPLTIETTSVTFEGTTLEVEAIGNIIEINDPPSGPGLYFTPGEIVRVKTEVATGITDLWFEVMSATQQDGYNRISVSKKSGTDATIPKGAAIVSYGHPGDGRILMTSDWRNDEGYSPYLDVFTIGASPWTADVGDIIPRMRLGQLKGVGVPGVSGISQWGMIAGSDLTDANSGYLVASDLGIRMVKVPLTFNNGIADTGSWSPDGNLRIGKNVGTDASTGFRVITTDETGQEGNVIIGNEAAGNFLRWNQASGVLTVSGTLLVTDPGATVTKVYVDDQDDYYDALAIGYGNNALANSKTYTNDRRLTKVIGTWTSGTNVITWASVALHFGNSGSVRSVTNGNTGTMAVRTYLYVDVSLGGTLAMIPSTTATVNNPNYVLIAVCDPGANGTTKASVNVVGGSTYISGGNIVTQSIVANSIAVDAIYSNAIQSLAIETRHFSATTAAFINSKETNANAYADSVSGTAQTDAQIYANRRRVVGVGKVDGTPGWGFGASNTQQITWTSLVLKLGDGSVVNVTNGSVTMNAGFPFTYLYANIGTGAVPNPITLLASATLTALGVNDVLVAVAEPCILTTATPNPGSGIPTLQVVAGATYISGDSIHTNSIVAQNIAANAITTAKINAGAVDTLQLATDAVTAAKIGAGEVTAAKVNVNGTIAINASGSINGNGKTYGSAGAGFFLGHSSNLYRFDIGNSTSYLRWDGDELLLRTATPVTIVGDSANTLFNFTTSTSPVQTGNVKLTQDTGTGRPVFTWSGAIETFDYIEAKNLIVTGVGSNPYEVFRVNANATTGVMNYNYVGRVLNWDSDFNAAGILYGNGLVIHANTIRIDTARTPVSGTGGVIGDFCWDGARLYICVATNTWRSVNTQPF